MSNNILSPANVNFTKCNGLCIYAGSFWSVPVTVLSRENLTDSPVDISGYVGSCVIKQNVNDDVPVATPEVTISQDVTGLFTISLSSSLSLNIPTVGRSFKDVNEMFYEVNLKDIISQESYRVLYGVVEVIPACEDADDNN